MLTLTAREQHIKRERATSNICTNQSLLALASAVYLSLLGRDGLRSVAELRYHKAHYAAPQLGSIKRMRVAFDSPFFHEFVLDLGRPAAEVNAHLLEHGILGGYDLGQDYPSVKEQLLIAVTETNSKELQGSAPPRGCAGESLRHFLQCLLYRLLAGRGIGGRNI